MSILWRLLRPYEEVVHQTLFVAFVSEHVLPMVSWVGGKLHTAIHEHAADVALLLLLLTVGAIGALLALMAVYTFIHWRRQPQVRRRNPRPRARAGTREQRTTSRRRASPKRH